MLTKRSIYLWIVFVLLFLPACQLTQLFSPSVPVIDHPKPETSEIGIIPFLKIGCEWKHWQYASCEEGSIAEQLGCQTLYKPSAYYGFLSPHDPFVRCYYFPEDFMEFENMEDGGLFNAGCAQLVYERLLLYRDGEYQLVINREALKSAFAPIESENEALSYALAAYDLTTSYDFDPPKDFRYYLEEIEDTYVNTTGAGYEVLLYGYQTCGCGPHAYYQQLILVTEAGDLRVLETNLAYADPEEDGLCVD